MALLARGLKNYAKHYQTGAPIPQALVDKLLAAEKFNQGFATLELVAANVIDQAWHQLPAGSVPGPDGVLEFEAAALRKAGLDFAPVPPRYRSTYFSHSFAGGYSAGYYSYFWSEVLDADSVEWMKSHGGLTRANGDHFRKTLLSHGGSDDAMTLFRNFTGGRAPHRTAAPTSRPRPGPQISQLSRGRLVGTNLPLRDRNQWLGPRGAHGPPSGCNASAPAPSAMP